MVPGGGSLSNVTSEKGTDINMLPNSNNKPTTKDRNSKAMTGIDKHLADAKSIRVGGVDHTPTTLKAVFQADIDATNVADAARTHWKQLVQSAKVTHKTAARTRQALKTYLVGSYGPDAVAILEDFGFQPPKPTGPKTVKAKAASVARAASTRTARHTMGPKQKKAIKGTAPGVVPADGGVHAPTAPSPATPGGTPVAVK